MDAIGPVVKSAAEGRSAAAVATRSSGRTQAILEVAVCSGFPTQLLLGAALVTIGLRATGDGGDLSFGYVVTLSLVDAVLVLGLIGFFLRARGESLRELVLGGRSPRVEARLGLLLVPALAPGDRGARLLGWLAPPGLRNVPENRSVAARPPDACAVPLVPSWPRNSGGVYCRCVHSSAASSSHRPEGGSYLQHRLRPGPQIQVGTRHPDGLLAGMGPMYLIRARRRTVVRRRFQRGGICGTRRGGAVEAAGAPRSSQPIRARPDGTAKRGLPPLKRAAKGGVYGLRVRRLRR